MADWILFLGCIDTKNWNPGYEKYDCNWYAKHWCKNRRPTNEWVSGSKANYPEENCCACGKKIEWIIYVIGFLLLVHTSKNLEMFQKKRNLLHFEFYNSLLFHWAVWFLGIFHGNIVFIFLDSGPRGNKQSRQLRMTGMCSWTMWIRITGISPWTMWTKRNLHFR